MGYYADEARTTNATAASDSVSPQRKPLPKGSDGSKPRARQPGEKPRPKKSGAVVDTARDQPTGSERTDTPSTGTFDDAKNTFRARSPSTAHPNPRTGHSRWV
jgi:hypothetical protein